MLSPRVPTLDSLELLLAIGRTGSLARAGAERGISQAAVSMRVTGMERAIGVRLVERGPTGSKLTVDGALVADWARDVLHAAERLDAGLTALREQDGSRLRIAASLTVAEHLLPGWLGRLRASRPGTTVSLVAANSAAVAGLVLRGEVELGFVEGPRVPAGLASRVVGGDRLVLVAAPGTPLARRRHPVLVVDFATLALIEREAGSGTRAALDVAAASAGPLERPVPLLEVSSTSAVRAAVLAGVGPAVVSSLAVDDDLAAGRLVAVPIRGVTLERRFHAVWQRGSSPLGAARDLLAVTAPRVGAPQRAGGSRPPTGRG